MKIISDKYAYIQEKDLQMLLKATTRENIPESILNTAADIIETGKTENPDNYRIFSGSDELSFFASLDYIVDGLATDKLSLASSFDMLKDVLKELREALLVSESLSDEASEAEKQRVKNNLELLRYKRDCAKSIMDEKKGKILFKGTEKKTKRNR